MQYRNFIKGCPKVSAIGVGGWQLGDNNGWHNITELDAINLVHKALDEGINFFDTAPGYGLGTSEERLGKALQRVERDKIVINTKFGHSEKGISDFSSSIIRSSLEGSLKRLQTDYVDSIIFHNPPTELLDGRKNDHYEILERLKEEGKIRGYGASLDTYEEIKLFLETTNGKVIEALFNILNQNVEKAFNLAKEKEVGIIVKIPLDSGWLTGKYNAESSFTGVRKRWTNKDIATRANLIERVKTILSEKEKISEKSISFCLGFDAVSTVIPGSKNVNQLLQNISSLEYPLENDVVRKLQEFYKNEVEKLKIPW